MNGEKFAFWILYIPLSVLWMFFFFVIYLKVTFGKLLKFEKIDDFFNNGVMVITGDTKDLKTITNNLPQVQKFVNKRKTKN